MKLSFYFLRSLRRLIVTVFPSVVGIVMIHGAGAGTVQKIRLVPGWNSVWLEVSPIYEGGDQAGNPKTVEDVFGFIDWFRDSVDRVAQCVDWKRRVHKRSLI